MMYTGGNPHLVIHPPFPQGCLGEVRTVKRVALVTFSVLYLVVSGKLEPLVRAVGEQLVHCCNDLVGVWTFVGEVT